MIQTLAEKTAKYLAKKDENADVEILTYGYYLIYQLWLVNIALLLIALPLRLFFQVLAALITFAIMRGPTVGAHANHPLICKLVTFLVVFIPSILGVLLADRIFAFEFTPLIVVILYIFALMLVIKYAPADTDVTKIECKDKQKQMKIKSILWLTTLFILALVVHFWIASIAFVIIITSVIACCFVHPWAYLLFGFDPLTREIRRGVKTSSSQ